MALRGVEGHRLHTAGNGTDRGHRSNSMRSSRVVHRDVRPSGCGAALEAVTSAVTTVGRPDRVRTGPLPRAGRSQRAVPRLCADIIGRDPWVDIGNEIGL